ncbi:MauE/DoxX family redox-associated membrane protein [Paenibacillus sp. Marseille-Q7038]
MYDLTAIFLTFPMFFSIVSYTWSKIFRDPHHFPGNSHMHRLLIVMQLISVTILLTISSVAGLLSLSILYLIQGIGVIYYLQRKGRVDCGCFGSQMASKLSYRLATGNGILAVISLSMFLHRWLQTRELPLSLSLEGLIIELLCMIFALVCVIGVPDAIYAIRAYRAIAATYYKKITK